jgi:DNA invertase Pin-like site-specific DNA recombinase
MLSDLSFRWTPYVVVADPARLARNQMLSLALELQLARYGTKLITATADDGHPGAQVTRKEDGDVTESN